MTRVSVSHLRQHLPAYLKRVQEGEAIQITSRGQVIARLEAEHHPAQAPRNIEAPFRPFVQTQRVPNSRIRV